MNYPCLQCVVEYMEANQRFRLSSKCPTIRSIERSIPLHLEQLKFYANTITINQCEYILKETVLEKIKEFTPGDISFYDEKSDDKSHHFLCSYQILHGRNGGREVLKNFLEGVTLHSAMKWMSCFFFNGRQVITTRKLKIMYVNVLRLPIGFKIKVIDQIETSMEYLNGISKFVQPNVREIVINLGNRHAWKHSLIQNAHQLSIKGIRRFRLEVLFDVTHKAVMLEDFLPKEFFERLIRKWIADKREIGSSLSFIGGSEQYASETLHNFKTMFLGRAVDRKVKKEDSTLNEALINSLDHWEKESEYRKTNAGRKLLYCICLPMNSTSELQISLFGRNQWTKENTYQILIKATPMNYPCLQCVVEYLEANLRFRLSSKCPKIRSIERSIPLHLVQLKFHENTITINQCYYELKETVLEKIKEFTPGDISFYNERRDDKSNYFSSSYQILHYIDGEREVLKNFPEGVTLHSAMKWMSCFFFNGRQVVTTRKPEVMDVNVLRLPVGFKIKVIDQIETSMEYLNGISKFVQPKIREIVINLGDHHAWEHNLIQNAHQLCIMGFRRFRTDVLFNVTHKRVILDDSLPNECFERLIRRWIADKREIGSLFSSIGGGEHYGLGGQYYFKNALEALLNLKKMFRGRAVDRKVTKEDSTLNEALINDLDRWEDELEYRKTNVGRELLYCICLPMNSTSELQISLFGRNQWTKKSKIDMEVVPINSLPTLEFDHVNYQIIKETFLFGTFYVLYVLFILSIFGLFLYYIPRKSSAS